jgi:hypothetical protein
MYTYECWSANQVSMCCIDRGQGRIAMGALPVVRNSEEWEWTVFCVSGLIVTWLRNQLRLPAGGVTFLFRQESAQRTDLGATSLPAAGGGVKGRRSVCRGLQGASLLCQAQLPQGTANGGVGALNLSFLQS